MKKLMLNCIVKNESARIERMLSSVVQFIDSWVIIDTGSTDDTKQKIMDFFTTHKVQGEIIDGEFMTGPRRAIARSAPPDNWNGCIRPTISCCAMRTWSWSSKTYRPSTLP